MKLSILSLALSIQAVNAFVSAPSKARSSALSESRIWQGEAGYKNDQQGFPHRNQGYSSPGGLNDVQSYTNAGPLARPQQQQQQYAPPPPMQQHAPPMQQGGPMPQGPMPQMRQDAHPNNPTVQGHSQATFANPVGVAGMSTQTNVELGSDGRPVHATVEHWAGPNNVPASMELFSEDGYAHPWIAQFRTAPHDAGGGVTQVRNVGPMEFPIQASVTTAMPGQGIGDQTVTMTPPKTVTGGSLKTFMFDPSTNSVYIEIFSQGRPINACVELWQGPTATKQLGRIYADDGNMRPWSAVIPLNTGYSGGGGTICVRNEGPMEYPITVRCDPPPINDM